MPLTPKGKKIEHAMEHEYGKDKGKQVFYASKNKGTIKGVEGKSKALKSKLSGQDLEDHLESQMLKRLKTKSEGVRNTRKILG